MSWQLGAFALLGLALAIGFAWYERSKPDARIVALVATLAAFAALGRIAFAAIPNVKPTTDIVLISGYALGGGPGFVVGALAGLTSNFFFGQGPWTPWQMAAWGATGLIGAGLATVTRGRITRWPLAIACAVVGFGFTAAQDLGDWVNYSDHSLAQLGVYVGKGVGFDLVHAAGCLAFALAFGPALTRSIARFAQRLSVAWRTFDGTAVPLLAVVCCVATLAPGHRARDRRLGETRCPTCSPRSTVTAASARAPARRRASCTRAGPHSDLPPPATTRSTSPTGAGACSATSAPAVIRTPARSNARFSPFVPPGSRCARSPATICSPRSSGGSGAMARSQDRSTGLRSACSRCAAPALRRRTR